MLGIITKILTSIGRLIYTLKNIKVKYCTRPISLYEKCTCKLKLREDERSLSIGSDVTIQCYSFSEIFEITFKRI